MRVERFSLFFPPTIARVRRGETEYAIGGSAAGGYVKITGMSPEELDGLDPRGRATRLLQPGAVEAHRGDPRRPGVNILIAFVLFWAVLFSGSLNGASALGNLDPSLPTLHATTSVRRGRATAARRRRAARRRPDHRRRRQAARRSSSAMHSDQRAPCAGAPAKAVARPRPVALTVRRAGHDAAVSVYPRYSKSKRRMLIGFELRRSGQVIRRPRRRRHIRRARCGTATTRNADGLRHALTSSKARHECTSIVGITEGRARNGRGGAGNALVFLGFISLVLAVINLFPFLPLDGGHVLWSVAEKVRGKRISLVAMYRFSSVGIVLLLFLVINGVSNDIGRLGG